MTLKDNRVLKLGVESSGRDGKASNRSQRKKRTTIVVMIERQNHGLAVNNIGREKLRPKFEAGTLG